jgi:uncharacterized membrane protein
MEDTVTTFYFAKPWALSAAIVLAPTVWLAVRSLGSLGRVRRYAAIGLRILSIVLLVSILAQFTLVRTNQQVTVVAVLDRSLSIPAESGQGMLEYLKKALEKKPEKDQLAIVDVAEAASISRLAGRDTQIHERNTTLRGEQSRLAEGIGMAMAIAPPNTAVRILFSSDGNETEGDVKKAAKLAAMNGIPVDVLGLRYEYDNEVVFKSLATPTAARSGQTVALRFILQSAQPTRGRLFLTMNDKPVDLDSDSPETAAVIDLGAGVNVKTVSVPLGTRGLHEFEAVFVPDGEGKDSISQNNRASGLTYVAGPGQVWVVDKDGSAGPALVKTLQSSQISATYVPAEDVPDSPARLLDIDAIILANTDCGSFSLEQQQMLCRFVNDLGGGLIMVGGPQAFGPGGWIGSPVAEILPVDLDPPQKKQMPRGALVLIMHSCEMPQGNLWGERTAIAAVNTLGAKDMAGLLAYDWKGGHGWAWPLSEVGDKSNIINAIKMMQVGDMPDLGAHLQEAYDTLYECGAGQKHVIVISDGDPAPPTKELLTQIKDAGITCSTVAVFPHSPTDVDSLRWVAEKTGGRFYNVSDPQKLPQIFIKEAQVVKRALIVEETFIPQITFALSDIVKGLSEPLPALDGYVLTGPKQGLSQVILSSPQGDPVLATCQSGLGRCAALTTSADSRWAGKWVAWSGYDRFWEQLVRWTARPAQPTDCEVVADVSGREVTVYVDASASGGNTAQWAQMDAQVIGPDMKTSPLLLTQTGPGQFQGRYEAALAGSYLVNLRYQKAGQDNAVRLMQTPITVPFAPEFKDMKDNAALLHEISVITGGRILSPNPLEANLFDPTGLKFPRTETPLTELLMLIWLGVFLMDVAVRRVVLDVVAIGRKAAGLFRKSGQAQHPDATVARLKERQKAIHQQLTRASQVQMQEKAATRYEPPKESSSQALPTMPQAEQKPVEPPKIEPSKPAVKPPEKTGYIDQLLKARKKAMDKEKNE